jgi:hypothetical protein
MDWTLDWRRIPIGGQYLDLNRLELIIVSCFCSRKAGIYELRRCSPTLLVK